MVINVKYWNGNTRKDPIIKAVNIINSLQNYYYLVLKSLDEDVGNNLNINWKYFVKIIRQRMTIMKYILQKRRLMIIGFRTRNTNFQ